MEFQKEELQSLHALPNQEKLKLLKHIKDYTLVYKDCLNLKKDTTFGLELEFLLDDFYYDDETRVEIYNSWFQELFHNHTSTFYSGSMMVNHDWLLSIDYDVDGEITSPILRDQKKDWEDVKKVCDLLKEKGAYGGDYASTQINIGGQIFQQSYEKFKNAMINYALFEDVFYYATKGNMGKYRAEIINYANPIAFKILKTEAPRDRYEFHQYVREATYGMPYGDKLSSLNLTKLTVEHGFTEDNIIELRMPNASFDIKTIQTWVSLFVNFFEHASLSIPYFNKYESIMKRKNYLPLETKEYNLCNFEKALELADMIFETPMEKYQFLKQYIRYHDYEKIEKQLLLK